MTYDFDNTVVKPLNKKFEVPDSGKMYNAIISYVWNVGRQQSEYNNEVKISYAIVVGFVLDQKDSDGENLVHYENYTVGQRNIYIHEKSTLAKRLCSITGKKVDIAKQILENEDGEIDFKKLIGLKCTLNFVESGKNGDKRRISSAMGGQDSNKLVVEDKLAMTGDDVPAYVKFFRKQAVGETVFNDYIKELDEKRELETITPIATTKKSAPKKNNDVELSEEVPF